MMRSNLTHTLSLSLSLSLSVSDLEMCTHTHILYFTFIYNKRCAHTHTLTLFQIRCAHTHTSPTVLVHTFSQGLVRMVDNSKGLIMPHMYPLAFSSMGTSYPVAVALLPATVVAMATNEDHKNKMGSSLQYPQPLS